MIADILLTALLVFLNGFFVAAEFAIVKVRQSQIELKANQGNTVARTSQHILNNMDGYLSACQLGITLASLALGWIGEPVVAKMVRSFTEFFQWTVAEDSLHQISIVIAFGLITVLHIVLGEQVPKTAAIRHPLRYTMIVAVPLRIFYVVFSPFIWVLNGLSTTILRVFGLKGSEHSDIHSEEEIRMLLTESEEGGAIKPSEHELIQNVFEFDDRVVRQILIPRTKISAIDVESTREEVVQKVIDEGYSRMPVYQDSLDNVIGVIYTKDLIKALHEKNFKGVNDLIRPAYFVPLNKRINDLLREFQTQHIQMAIVTNEFGGTAGIVTMEDLLEELFGDIKDEYDVEELVEKQLAVNEFIFSGRIELDFITEKYELDFPNSEATETLSGYIIQNRDGIPKEKESFTIGNYHFDILNVSDTRIETVKLKVLK